MIVIILGPGVRLVRSESDTLRLAFLQAGRKSLRAYLFCSKSPAPARVRGTWISESTPFGGSLLGGKGVARRKGRAAAPCSRSARVLCSPFRRSRVDGHEVMKA